VAQKKQTKKIKVRDLKPIKDVKGGFGHNVPPGQQVSLGSVRRFLLIGLDRNLR
jgi:hypothetical protein